MNKRYNSSDLLDELEHLAKRYQIDPYDLLQSLTSNDGHFILTKMYPMLQLPNEILVEIFSNLDFRTILILSSTCTTLRNLVFQNKDSSLFRKNKLLDFNKVKNSPQAHKFLENFCFEKITISIPIITNIFKTNTKNIPSFGSATNYYESLAKLFPAITKVHFTDEVDQANTESLNCFKHFENSSFLYTYNESSKIWMHVIPKNRPNWGKFSTGSIVRHLEGEGVVLGFRNNETIAIHYDSYIGVTFYYAKSVSDFCEKYFADFEIILV